MLTVGVDIGTGSTKVVLMEDGTKVTHKVLDDQKGTPQVVSARALDKLLEDKGLTRADITYIASTGYGRYQMEERQIQITDLTTTGRGANYVYKNPHLLLDIGNQSTRALRVNDAGKIIQFKLSERCAAGSGRFIERCSKYLTVPMDKVSETAMKATEPQTISSVCAVLSETEIINHVSQGIPVENIFMGVLLSIADRATTLIKRVKLDEDVYITGGLVLLPAMQKALEKAIGYPIHMNPDAHYAAAIGAAKLGYQRATKLAN